VATVARLPHQDWVAITVLAEGGAARVLASSLESFDKDRRAHNGLGDTGHAQGYGRVPGRSGTQIQPPEAPDATAIVMRALRLLSNRLYRVHKQKK